MNNSSFITKALLGLLVLIAPSTPLQANPVAGAIILCCAYGIITDPKIQRCIYRNKIALLSGVIVCTVVVST